MTDPTQEEINSSTFDTVSQSAHFWFGGWVIFLSSLIGYMWAGFTTLLIFSAIKEFWYDYKYETAVVRGSSERDFLYYMLGGVITAIIVTTLQ